MGSTLTTIDAMLKQVWEPALQSELNNTTEVLSLVQKDVRKHKYQGKVYKAALHVSRNSGTGITPEGGTLPTAGNQGVVAVDVNLAYAYGRMQITGQSMILSQGGEAAAVVDALRLEMDGLRDDMSVMADRFCTSGNLIVGFLCEHRSQASGSTWQFFGDYAKVANALTAKGSAVTITLYRCDTFATVGTATAISASDASAGTITITSTGAVDTSSVATGYAIAVAITDTDAKLTNGTSSPVMYIPSEPFGMYHNLANLTIGGLSRVTYPKLVAPILTCATTGTHGATAFSSTRAEALIDQVYLNTGKRPDVILANQMQLQGLTTVAYATTVRYQEGTSKDGNGLTMGLNRDQIKFAEIPLVFTRFVDDGIYLFMSKDSWRFLENPQAAVKWIDEDGSVLRRVVNTDAFEAAVRWWFNLICLQPNRNGILTGVTRYATAAPSA